MEWLGVREKQVGGRGVKPEKKRRKMEKNGQDRTRPRDGTAREDTTEGNQSREMSAPPQPPATAVTDTARHVGQAGRRHRGAPPAGWSTGPGRTVTRVPVAGRSAGGSAGGFTGNGRASRPTLVVGAVRTGPARYRAENCKEMSSDYRIDGGRNQGSRGGRDASNVTLYTFPVKETRTTGFTTNSP